MNDLGGFDLMKTSPAALATVTATLQQAAAAASPGSEEETILLSLAGAVDSTARLRAEATGEPEAVPLVDYAKAKARSLTAGECHTGSQLLLAAAERFQGMKLETLAQCFADLAQKFAEMGQQNAKDFVVQ